MDPKQIEDIVEAIASELLTVQHPGGFIKGTRMQIMRLMKDGTEENLGGRNETSIKRVIRDHVAVILSQSPTAPQSH